MLIKSIMVRNFRSFKGTSTFYPCSGKESGITVVVGEDRTSLEELYNACQWCLRNRLSFKDETDFLLDENTADKMADGASVTVQVEIDFSVNELSYAMVKTQRYTRVNEAIRADGGGGLMVYHVLPGGKRKQLSPQNADQVMDEMYRDITVHLVYDEGGRYNMSRFAPTLLEMTGQVILFVDRIEWESARVHIWDKVGRGYSIAKSVEYSIDKRYDDIVRNKEEAEVAAKSALKRFELPGREELETFFNDHVVDIIRDDDRYRKLGVDFPGAVILHGLPGCGKTYAVERLGDFLGWPRYYIDSGSIGSAYLHETSKRINDIFEQAMQNAPAIVVIDEMDAFLSNRGSGWKGDDHHTEEVSEFLRKIPEARANHVFVVGMTNRLESIDEAFLRRGRFDHILEVGMPSAIEVEAALEKLLSGLPTTEDVDCTAYARALAGRPMSDISFTVKEAGRLAARAKKDAIDAEAFSAALDNLPNPLHQRRQIGFNDEAGFVSRSVLGSHTRLAV